ncbi:hypothetical protein AABB24_012437, partial [Solanum stoloniferum]
LPKISLLLHLSASTSPARMATTQSGGNLLSLVSLFLFLFGAAASLSSLVYLADEDEPSSSSTRRSAHHQQPAVPVKARRHPPREPPASAPVRQIPAPVTPARIALASNEAALSSKPASFFSFFR